MKFLINLILSNLLCFQSVFATLNDVDKTQIVSKNLLTNGGFELGKANWTASAGTFAITTSLPMIGKTHATWDAAASADTLSYDLVSIPVGMYGRNGVASCLFTTASGTATHTIQAHDGTNILSSTTVMSSTTPQRTSTNFIFPSSGDVKLRIYANANEPSIAIDDCFIAPAEAINIGSVSQTTFIASGYIAGTTGCTWTSSNASMVAFGTDIDCPGVTVVSNPGPGTLQTTDTNLPRFTVNGLSPGTYQVTLRGGRQSNTTTGNINCFAINDGTDTKDSNCMTINASGYGFMQAEAFFTYATGGNKTFEIYARSPSAQALYLINEGAYDRISFEIVRYPTTSETIYTPDVSASSWSGYHDNTCSGWTRTNAAYGDFTDDASCALVQATNTNFGTVSTVGSVSPAIMFTPKAVIKYVVCSVFSASSLATNPTLSFRLTDGTTTIADTERRPINSSGLSDFESVTLCGLYQATSTSSVTLKIQSAASTGAVVIGTPSGTIARSSIEWSIVAINQSLPAPLLVNTVVSKYAGVSGVESAEVSSAGSVSKELGDWISGSCTNANPMVCTLNAGVFSSAPTCVCSTAQTGTAATCHATVSSATSVSLTANNDLGAAAVQSIQKGLICHGPR